MTGVDFQIWSSTTGHVIDIALIGGAVAMVLGMKLRSPKGRSSRGKGFGCFFGGLGVALVAVVFAVVATMQASTRLASDLEEHYTVTINSERRDLLSARHEPQAILVTPDGSTSLHPAILTITDGNAVLLTVSATDSQEWATPGD